MNKDNTRYMFTLFSLTENQLVCFSWNCRSSPAADELGIVFVFSNDTNIHNCLILPSVATVAGMWGDRDTLLSSPCQVCRKEGFYVVVCILMNMCLCLCVARGASSKMNFMNWLESVIQGLTKYNCLVYHGSVRQHGFYHHILMSDLF